MDAPEQAWQYPARELDVDFQKYIILGFCNPPFAYKALQSENKIGLMLPCNVIVQEMEGELQRASELREEVSAMDAIDLEIVRLNQEIAFDQGLSNQLDRLLQNGEEVPSDLELLGDA